MKELDADSRKAQKVKLWSDSSTTAKNPSKSLKVRKINKKMHYKKMLKMLCLVVLIDFKNIIPPTETLKSIGPFVDTGTLFHKLPEKALEMAYFNVASKFPRQSLDMQGMPINISEQREALMAGLKDQLKRDQQSRTMLTKIMNKTQGLS